MNILEIKAALRSMPEVTKAQAVAKAILLAEMAGAGHEGAIAALAEIAGMAATCDDPEMVRRFIVLKYGSGPTKLE